MKLLANGYECNVETEMVTIGEVKRAVLVRCGSIGIVGLHV